MWETGLRGAGHGVVVPWTLTLINAPPSRENASMQEKVRRLIGALTSGLYERDQAVRLALLATVAGESIFFLGPPGVGKSLIARRMTQSLQDAKSFEYLMGRFSTPDEVFGPLSISHLKEHDAYQRKIEHYLPDAEIVFLDEIWKASPPIQNALLTALNERLFRNGTTEIRIPLQVFIGASNELPEPESGTEAFWDRFLIRLVLDPISEDGAFQALLEDTRDLTEDLVPSDLKVSLEELRQVRRQAQEVALGPLVGGFLARLRERLTSERDAGLAVSDRRWKKVASLLRTSAVLHGRDRVSLTDLSILPHCIWSTREAQPTAERLVDAVLEEYAGAEFGNTEAPAQQLEALRTQAAALTTHHATTEMHRPVLYREEYVRILDHPEADLVLIWRGDLENVGQDATAEVELFAYDAEETFSHTMTCRLTRIAPYRVAINGGTYVIENETVTETVAESRRPDPAERERWHADVDVLAARIAKQTSRLTDALDRHNQEAARHLFLDDQRSHAIRTGVERAIAERNDLLIKLHEMRSDHPELE